MDMLQEKPATPGFIQRLTSLNNKRSPPQQNVFLSPSLVNFPCLDPHGNITILNESLWDKHPISACSMKNYPKLQVVCKDGKWYALNSAQLQLFQKWEREGKCAKVKVDIVSLHHVPATLRNLMTVGADRKLYTQEISDRFKNGNKEASTISSFSHPTKADQYHPLPQTVSTFNISTISASASSCGPSHEQHKVLTSSKSAPNGIVVTDSEQNTCVSYSSTKDRDRSQRVEEHLYKTTSSFQLEKQCDILPEADCGVATARGYHQVGQCAHDEDEDDTDEDEEDDSDCEDDEDDDEEDSHNENDCEYTTGESEYDINDNDSEYSLGPHSDFDWSENGDEDEIGEDDDLDDQGSEYSTGEEEAIVSGNLMTPPVDVVDENESLL